MGHKKVRAQTSVANTDKNEPLNTPDQGYQQAATQTRPNLNRGRWTILEKYLFYKYSIKIKKGDPSRRIAQIIKTRDYQQVRSHAQKINMKLMKDIKIQMAYTQAQREIQNRGNQIVTRYNGNSAQRSVKSSKHSIWQKPDSEYRQEVEKKMRQEMIKLLPFINESDIPESQEEEPDQTEQPEQKMADVIKMEEKQPQAKKEQALPPLLADNIKFDVSNSYFVNFLLPILPQPSNITSLIEFPKSVRAKSNTKTTGNKKKSTRNNPRTSFVRFGTVQPNNGLFISRFSSFRPYAPQKTNNKKRT